MGIGAQSSNLTGLVLKQSNVTWCRGRVTAWNYCYYYQQPSGSEAVLEAYFAAYRLTNNGTYKLLPESWHRVTKEHDNYRVIGLYCEVELLREDEQFELEEDDVVASCLISFDGVNKPLHIVTTGDEQSLSTLLMPGHDTNQCSRDTVYNIHLQTLTVDETGATLHLSPEVKGEANVY